MPKQETALAEVEAKNITGMITPAGTIEDTIKQFKLYQELKNRLATSDDFQLIGNKKHPKKSFVRKVQRFFNLSCELLRDEPLRDGNGDIIAWVATARAIHLPTGAFQDADGSCSFDEKVERQRTIHNIRAHAITRAKNRAILDLVGFGDVSAEEINEAEYHTHTSGNGSSRPRGGGSPKYACSGCGVDIQQNVYDYSMKNFSRPLCRDCQKKERGQDAAEGNGNAGAPNWTAFWTAAKEMGYDNDQVHEEARWYFSAPDLQSLKDVVKTDQDLKSFLNYLQEKAAAQ